MSHDEILDQMSFSDDEMLDDLADDMMMEIEQEHHQTHESIPTIQPMRTQLSRPVSAPITPAFNPNQMPNLGQMMSQMMPMMNEILGNSISPNQPRGVGGAHIQRERWDEVIRKELPSEEAEKWIQTIQADEESVSKQKVNKVHSRSYRMNPNRLPSVYMEHETMLANILHESVRAAHCENPAWHDYHENLVSNITNSGLAKVYQKHLKSKLLELVQQDTNYTQAKERFPNITKALY
jgi:hypothetical protein